MGFICESTIGCRGRSDDEGAGARLPGARDRLPGQSRCPRRVRAVGEIGIVKTSIGGAKLRGFED